MDSGSSLQIFPAVFKQLSSRSLLQSEYISPKSPSISKDFPHSPVLELFTLTIASSIPVTKNW